MGETKQFIRFWFIAFNMEAWHIGPLAIGWWSEDFPLPSPLPSPDASRPRSTSGGSDGGGELSRLRPHVIIHPDQDSSVVRFSSPDS